MSDAWAAYRTLGRVFDVRHFTVTHRRYFVNPRTGYHTQNIEAIWGAAKRFLRRRVPGRSR